MTHWKKLMIGNPDIYHLLCLIKIVIMLIFYVFSIYLFHNHLEIYLCICTHKKFEFHVFVVNAPVGLRTSCCCHESRIWDTVIVWHHGYNYFHFCDIYLINSLSILVFKVLDYDRIYYVSQNIGTQVWKLQNFVNLIINLS